MAAAHWAKIVLNIQRTKMDKKLFWALFKCTKNVFWQSTSLVLALVKKCPKAKIIFAEIIKI